MSAEIFVLAVFVVAIVLITKLTNPKSSNMTPEIIDLCHYFKSDISKFEMIDYDFKECNFDCSMTVATKFKYQGIIYVFFYTRWIDHDRHTEYQSRHSYQFYKEVNEQQIRFTGEDCMYFLSAIEKQKKYLDESMKKTGMKINEKRAQILNWMSS